MTDTQSKTVIEVNGVKMEVDLRHATRIDQLVVGDRVKVLKKEYTDYRVYAGVVVGFEAFQKLPTIIVAYVKADFTDATVEFIYFNSESKDVEIIKAIDDDTLDLSKPEVMKAFDRELAKLDVKARELKEKRAYVEKHFNAYWKDIEQEQATV